VESLLPVLQPSRFEIVAWLFRAAGGTDSDQRSQTQQVSLPLKRCRWKQQPLRTLLHPQQPLMQLHPQQPLMQLLSLREQAGVRRSG
jgi:hypothetical protein